MSEYLPIEVIVEILKRLPVKSVVKCMSVCKTWNILIKNPSFISTHLQTSLSKHHNHLLFVKYSPNPQKTFSLHFDDDKFDEFKQLLFPVAFNDYSPFFEVVGSCNGLVCLFDYLGILNSVFWNPSIQKYIALLKPSSTRLTENASVIFGFGFDSRASDYKLLMLLIGGGETLDEAYLFSLNENSWKRVTASFPECAIESQISPTFVHGALRDSAFVNGAFHWVGYQIEQHGRFRFMILGFDISTEQFFVIKLPESLIGSDYPDLSVKKYEESSIAVLRRYWRSDNQLDLWVMKKYGVVGSWTKMLHLTDQSGFGRRPRVLGFRNNGEVLLKADHGKMVSLDLNCQQMEHLEIELLADISFVNHYVQSLVLLDKGVDAGSVSSAKHANDSSGSGACCI